MGLGHLDKASPACLAPLTIALHPFREPLAGPLKQDWACSQRAPCLLPVQEKARLPGWGLTLPPPSPFLFVFPPLHFSPTPTTQPQELPK